MLNVLNDETMSGSNSGQFQQQTPPVRAQPVRRNGPQLSSALNELKQLRTIDNHQFLQVNTNMSSNNNNSRRQGTSANVNNRMKENYPPPPPPPAHPSSTGRPFTSLINALKQMNGELGSGKKNARRLLQCPSPSTSREPVAVELPRIHRRSRPVQSHHTDITSTHTGGVMPTLFNQQPALLQLGPNTDRSNGMPFPMLRLTSSNSNIDHRVPYFVPPQELPSYQCNEPGKNQSYSPRLLKLTDNSKPLRQRQQTRSCYLPSFVSHLSCI